MDNQSKIILIAGPTASGKSNFAVNLAKKIDGEIINADSMQIYKQLKILTARPNKKIQKKIRHHLYGIVNINKNFSTGAWLKLAVSKIKEMKELPKIVAQTEVGKIVEVKVWRNEKELTKKIKLGRLETSEDFKTEKKEEADPNISEIKTLKISVRVLSAKDVKDRKLPENTSGLVITNVQQDSPINYLKVNDIIIEAQKEKIRSVKDFERIINNVLQSSEKTMLIAIYNNQNQRRYIGVKLD